MSNNLEILLVHPNGATKIYQDLSKNFSAKEPPVVAALITKYLLNKGINADILDCEANELSIEESFQKIKSLNPKIVCVVVYGQQPSASSQNMYGAELLMDKLKESEIVRIYVGPTPTSLPEFIINRDNDVLVCAGEGPKTLESLNQVKDFNNNSELEKVPGLCFYNKKQNQVIKNLQAPLIIDLDGEMPSMPWDLLPMDKYRTANWHGWTNFDKYNNQPFASIYTSFGCPYQCIFCMINSPFNQGNNKNNSIRNWNIESIGKTLEYLANKGITNLKIADEMHVLHPKHFLAICQLIIDRGYKFNTWCYARVSTIQERYLEIMRKSGIRWVGIGIESANQTVRQESTKGNFTDINIRNIVQKTMDHDICVTGNYIFGLTSDTHETMQETLDLALELKTDYANFYSCMAYPGSQLHRDWLKKNPSVLPENNPGIGWLGYSQHSYETFNLPTETLTNAEVLQFRENAFHTYFTNQAYLERMKKKFGQSFQIEIDKMMNVKLKRKILGN